MSDAMMRIARFTAIDDMHAAICDQWNADGTCCRNCIDCTAIDEARGRIKIMDEGEEVGR